jgi:hypothetical protein
MRIDLRTRLRAGNGAELLDDERVPAAYLGD